MINTTTSVSGQFAELGFPTGSEMSSQYNTSTRMGTIFASDAEHFFLPGQMYPLAMLEAIVPNAASDVSNQVNAFARTSSDFASTNDSESFLPWYTISQVLVDTTIGNTIQVIQQSPIRQVWG